MHKFIILPAILTAFIHFGCGTGNCDRYRESLVKYVAATIETQIGIDDLGIQSALQNLSLFKDLRGAAVLDPEGVPVHVAGFSASEASEFLSQGAVSGELGKMKVSRDVVRVGAFTGGNECPAYLHPLRNKVTGTHTGSLLIIFSGDSR